MFSLGGSEILIIAVLVLMLFGPDKIPELAKTIGRARREFNKYKDIVESTIHMEIDAATGPTERADARPSEDGLAVEERLDREAAASQAALEARVAGLPEPQPEQPQPESAPSRDDSAKEGEV
jgi:TatA/E family protein of Tat protein translocase